MLGKKLEWILLHYVDLGELLQHPLLGGILVPDLQLQFVCVACGQDTSFRDSSVLEPRERGEEGVVVVAVMQVVMSSTSGVSYTGSSLMLPLLYQSLDKESQSVKEGQ